MTAKNRRGREQQLRGLQDKEENESSIAPQAQRAMQVSMKRIVAAIRELQEARAVNRMPVHDQQERLRLLWLQRRALSRAWLMLDEAGADVHEALRYLAGELECSRIAIGRQRGGGTAA